MANWQEKIGDTFKSVTDKQEALVSGVQQGISLAGDNMGRLATFQLGVVADGADAAVAQVKLLGQPGTPITYFKQQVGFVTEGARTAKGKATEFGDLVSDCATDTVALFGISAKAKTKPRSKKAA